MLDFKKKFNGRVNKEKFEVERARKREEGRKRTLITTKANKKLVKINCSLNEVLLIGESTELSCKMKGRGEPICKIQMTCEFCSNASYIEKILHKTFKR